MHRVSESDELTPDLILDLSGGGARFSYRQGGAELTVEFYCRDGRPMLRGEGSAYPLKPGRTFQILSDSRGSEGIVQYQITWLDEKEVRTC